MSNFRKKEEQRDLGLVTLEDGELLWKTEKPRLTPEKCIHIRLMLGDAGYSPDGERREVDLLCRDCGFVWNIGLRSLTSEASIDPLYVTDNWYEFLTINDRMLESLAEHLWKLRKEFTDDKLMKIALSGMEYKFLEEIVKSYYRRCAAEVIKVLKTV